jgi:hypothetical protein
MGKQDKFKSNTASVSTKAAAAESEAVEAVDGVVTTEAEVATEAEVTGDTLEAESTDATAATEAEAHIEAVDVIPEPETEAGETVDVTENVAVTEAGDATAPDTLDYEAAARLSQERAAEYTEVEAEQEVKVTEQQEGLFLGNFKGVTVGAGSFVSSYAKKLIDAVHSGELDYVIVASSRVNGVERAVLVSPALFAQINGAERFSALSKSISWAVSAPSFSSDALFAGRTAIAVGEFGVARAMSAAALMQDQTKLFGYIVGAADFHASFAA